MISSFFYPPPATRIEKCNELNNVVNLLNRLRSKEAELQKMAEANGKDSIDYRKYLVVANILRELDAVINAFNASTVDPDRETDDIIKLVRDLAGIINFSLNHYKRTLLTFRNDQQDTMRRVVTVGVYGVTIGSTTALSFSTFGSLFSLLWVAPEIGEKVLKLTGLDKAIPATFKIIDELAETLTRIGQNLGLEKNWNKASGSQPEEDVPDNFLCLITKCLMINPVVCKLDGKTYEESAIKKWLSTHKKSPFNLQNLPPGYTIDEVLVPNRNLKDLIDDFILAHPHLLESNEPDLVNSDPNSERNEPDFEDELINIPANRL